MANLLGAKLEGMKTVQANSVCCRAIEGRGRARAGMWTDLHTVRADWRRSGSTTAVLQCWAILALSKPISRYGRGLQYPTKLYANRNATYHPWPHQQECLYLLWFPRPDIGKNGATKQPGIMMDRLHAFGLREYPSTVENDSVPLFPAIRYRGPCLIRHRHPRHPVSCSGKFARSFSPREC